MISTGGGRQRNRDRNRQKRIQGNRNNLRIRTGQIDRGTWTEGQRQGQKNRDKNRDWERRGEGQG